MTNISKWNDDPWLNRLIPDFFHSDRFFGSDILPLSSQPKVNVSENDKEYRLEISVPGMHKKDIHVNVEENRLVIRGEKEEKKEKEDENYSRREFMVSSFERSFLLPENANPDNIEAKFEDGILNLTLQKKVMSEPKRKKEVQIA